MQFGQLPAAGGPYTVNLNGPRAVTSVFTGSALGPASGAVVIEAGSDPFSTLSVGGTLASVAAAGADLTLNLPLQLSPLVTLSHNRGVLRLRKAVVIASSPAPRPSSTAAPAGCDSGPAGWWRPASARR